MARKRSRTKAQDDSWARFHVDRTRPEAEGRGRRPEGHLTAKSRKFNPVPLVQLTRLTKNDQLRIKVLHHVPYVLSPVLRARPGGNCFSRLLGVGSRACAFLG